MSSTLFDLTGKVALITGSSKGIGLAIAEEMARHGAQVVISSRKADVCQEVADAINLELADEVGGATVIPAHIGRKEDLQDLVDKTREALGTKWQHVSVNGDGCGGSWHPEDFPAYLRRQEWWRPWRRRRQGWRRERWRHRWRHRWRQRRRQQRRQVGRRAREA